MHAILFLDDDGDRHLAFSARVPHAQRVYDAYACIACLKEQAWEECHLDHDLTGEAYCDSDREDCGMEVVRWICCNKPDVRTFVVHTHNEIAGPQMVAALEAAGYRVVRAPFSLVKRFDSELTIP
jgi:hypothetical protein